jgi:hypothetical protein
VNRFEEEHNLFHLLENTNLHTIMSQLASTPQNPSHIPVPTITLQPAPRNEFDAIDFQEFLLFSPANERVPMIHEGKVKVVDDHLRTPPPQFILPMTPVEGDGALPFLPSLNTPPPVREGVIHLEARGSHNWAIHHNNARPPASASPRDVVAESKAAFIHGTADSSIDHKKGAYEESDHGELRRAWPLEDDRDPSCSRYIEDANSDTSSLSSSPWEFQGDTDCIFRMRSKLGSPTRQLEWPRSPVRYDADSQKALQMFIRSAPPLCVSTSDCSSTSSCCEDDVLSHAPTKKYDHHYHHHNHYHHEEDFQKLPMKQDANTVDMEKSTTGRGRRLREAFELLIDVFTPECCAPHMRVGSRPGVLKPWHILVPAPQTPQRESSLTRLRGCYL